MQFLDQLVMYLVLYETMNISIINTFWREYHDCFVLFDLLHPSQQFSVMSGWDFLG